MSSPRSDPVADAVELSLAPGLTPVVRRRLGGRVLDLSELVGLPRSRLEAVGVPAEAAEALATRRSAARAREIVARSSREGFVVVIASSQRFPRLLHELPDPPFVLYCQGDLALLDSPAVAIVGTRRPSHYGLGVAASLAGELGGRGIVVTSGLARGIDAAAHRGCLERKGATIAVLGTGIDLVYPREHGALARQIARQGLLVTEFPPGTPPLARNFPVRNRIISGLTLGTVVVEAEESSGSLVTARLALEQNRELLAVPGNLTSPSSVGPNFLIKQGAKLVQGWRDVVEELPATVRQSILDRDVKNLAQPAEEGLNELERRVLRGLGADRAVHFDALLVGLEVDFPMLSNTLLHLELRGLIRQLPGGWYLKGMQAVR